MSVLNRDVNIDRFWQDPGSSVDTLPEPKENKQERGVRWEGWAEGVHTVQKKDEVTWQRAGSLPLQQRHLSSRGELYNAATGFKCCVGQFFFFF